jgi:extradiol dioxygenase family protein
MGRPCFHLSIPCHDLALTERWYVDGLGCVAGRRSNHALILDLQGHQLVLQRTARKTGLRFGVEPKLRFAGEVLEHHTFFLIDPASNWLEFKHYTEPTAVLGCRDQRHVGERRC